jgi:hypothetical protein
MDPHFFDDINFDKSKKCTKFLQKTKGLTQTPSVFFNTFVMIINLRVPSVFIAIVSVYHYLFFGMEAHHGAIEAHLVAVESHPGDSLEPWRLTLELQKPCLEPWRLILEPSCLTFGKKW